MKHVAALRSDMGHLKAHQFLLWLLIWVLLLKLSSWQEGLTGPSELWEQLPLIILMIGGLGPAIKQCNENS